MFKTIYTFNVPKKTKVEEKRVEKYTEDGVEKERTISETVEKEVQVEILLREPNRRQIQEAELVYAVEMSKYIKLGVVTKAMLLNKYKDTGGIASNTDSQDLAEKYKQLEDLQKDIISLRIVPDAEKTAEQKQELAEKEGLLVLTQKEIVVRETSYLNLFNHTADTFAQNKSCLWYVLNLSYVKDPTKHKDFVPLFEGKTFEEKEEYLCKLEESNDEIYTNSYLKLSNIFSYWFFSGSVNKEEFDKIANG